MSIFQKRANKFFRSFYVGHTNSGTFCKYQLPKIQGARFVLVFAGAFVYFYNSYVKCIEKLIVKYE